MLRSLLRDKLELIICLTKIDEVVPTQFEVIEDLFRKEIKHPFDFIKISALENRNIQELKMSYPLCRANEIGRRQCSDYQSAPFRSPAKISGCR